MALSDELHKVDISVENTTRKIANQLFDISDSNQSTPKYELLTVANSK